MYNYKEALIEDLMEYVVPSIDTTNLDEDELYNDIYDSAWVDDYVTGNGTLNGYKHLTEDDILDCLKGNLGLYKEAVAEWGEPKTLSFLTMDATIRCWMLSDAVWAVVKRIKGEE